MNVDYFIKKFEAIPEALWCTGFYETDGRRCATGHCGYLGAEGFVTEEAKAFWSVIDKLDTTPSEINDGGHPDYKQLTPKARILAALQDIKEQ